MSDDQQLGATGRFPQGKLVPNDEGELHMRVGTFDGKVVVEFGASVVWFGLDPAGALELADSLRGQAEYLLKEKEQPKSGEPRPEIRVVGTATGQIDVKRFYLNGVGIHTLCPKCGVPQILDLGSFHLDYPVVNAPHTIHTMCTSCEAEFSISVVLRMALEPA